MNWYCADIGLRSVALGGGRRAWTIRLAEGQFSRDVTHKQQCNYNNLRCF